MFTNACITVWCYPPSPSPSLTPSVTPSPSVSASPSASADVSPKASPSLSPKASPNKFDDDNCKGTRLRKELRCMSEKEQTAYTTAFMKANKNGMTQRFTQTFDTNSWEATGGANFLPWARTYLRRYENILREIDSDLALPHWDFTADASDIQKSVIWDVLGSTSKEKCLSKRPWDKYRPAYPKKHCVKRTFAAKEVDGVETIRRLVLQSSSYENFADAAEYIFHKVREAVGGEMATKIAPNDPAFLPLLATFDRYWAVYQLRGDIDKWDITGDHRGSPVLDDKDGYAAFGGKNGSDVLEVKCVKYEKPCKKRTESTGEPNHLGDKYIKENELPKKRIDERESDIQALLYGIEIDDTPNESPDS